MVSPVIEIGIHSGRVEEASNPVRVAKRERTHGKAVSVPAEYIGSSPDMVVFLQYQDPPALLGQPGGAAEATEPCPDNDDIKGHAAFAAPADHSFCIPLKAFNTSIRPLIHPQY
jgi:hypothetical protein